MFGSGMGYYRSKAEHGRMAEDSIVISNLPVECKEPDLLTLALSYGRIRSCEIKRDFRNHSIAVFGLLKYFNAENAWNAYHSLQGVLYFGKTLRVDWRTSNRRNLPRVTGSALYSPRNSSSRTAQVHFSYLSKQLDFMISENFLRDVFNNFGPVIEIALKKSAVDPEMAVQNGYGFVHFPLTESGIRAALGAVKGMHRVTLNNITFDCSISNQLNQILNCWHGAPRSDFTPELSPSAHRHPSSSANLFPIMSVGLQEERRRSPPISSGCSEGFGSKNISATTSIASNAITADTAESSLPSFFPPSTSLYPLGCLAYY